MTGYFGNVAIPYDQDLGPVLFEHYGADIAQRTVERSLKDVLEVAVGAGIIPVSCVICSQHTTDCNRHQ
ncbi:MAG: hypothetical protein DU489_13550 [Nitrosomonas sp.]|jgi:hypothetical protein